jgi:ribosomal protein S18 acetylase RimI-like enzyme
LSAAALVQNTPFNGLRPVNLRTDLAGMAELIELCFGPTMDEAGRAAVREMRMISRSGSLTLIFHGLDRLLGGLEQGYVWIEDGRLIGNVSVSPANYPHSMGTGFVIANVAVHPDFRRQGLAQALMQASLDLIRQRGGEFAVLQVDDNNEGARRLYSRLNFREERTFIRWHRSSHARSPKRLSRMPDITLRQANEWRAEYELAQAVRPNERGGLGWLRPTHPNFFRPSLVRTLASWTTGRSEDHWIVRDESKRGLLGSLRTTSAFGSADRFELLVDPAQQGQLEDPLINFALRGLEGRRRPVTMEHPADDQITTALLERYEFERRYTLVHMRYDFNQGNIKWLP